MLALALPEVPRSRSVPTPSATSWKQSGQRELLDMAWSVIGVFVGTSRKAASQRYGHKVG